MEKNTSLENELVRALFKDRRAERRWKVIRSFVWVLLLLLWAFLIFRPAKDTSSTQGVMTGEKPYAALIRLNGEIFPGHAFSAKKVIPELNRAFKDPNARGVLLLINSPGGSPVQASIIHDRILFLKNRYKKKVVVVGEDALASGAYLVACAADKIYVQADTLTGSIGVIMSSFGLNDAIKKLGISRRVFTAGKDKDRLDPFKPLNPEDAQKVTALLNEVHQNFIEAVIEGRKGRLSRDRAQLFSGDFWTGTTAVKLGLADGVEDSWTVLKKEFNVTQSKDYSEKPSLLKLLIGDARLELNQVLGQESHAQLRAQL